MDRNSWDFLNSWVISIVQLVVSTFLVIYTNFIGHWSRQDQVLPTWKLSLGVGDISIEKQCVVVLGIRSMYHQSCDCIGGYPFFGPVAAPSTTLSRKGLILWQLLSVECRRELSAYYRKLIGWSVDRRPTLVTRDPYNFLSLRVDPIPFPCRLYAPL